MLTVAEQTVEKCCQELKERLSSFITEKEIIKGEDQAITNQSIMQILVDVFMPKWTRMRFRLLENEKDFVIEIYDSHGEQEMQPVTIRFKYEFDWKIGSWEEAKAIKKPEDRIALLNYWKSNGMRVTDIAKHFGLKYDTTIYTWQQNRCIELGYKERCNISSHSTKIRKIVTVLNDAGLKNVSSRFMAKLLNCDATLVNSAKQYMKRQATVLTIDETDIDRAIAYIKLLLLEFESYAKRIESQDGIAHDWTARTIYELTGIELDNRVGYNCQTGKHLIRLNCHQYNKVTDYLNNVLDNLNQKRKELAA